jgi:hypothetical protein
VQVDPFPEEQLNLLGIVQEQVAPYSLAWWCVCTVLLAPYSLAGALTGRSFSESDHKTQKLLEDWRRFYYLSKTSGAAPDSGVALGVSEEAGATGAQMPAAVEVIVGESLLIV